MAGKTRITSATKKARMPKEKKKMLSYKEKLGLGYPDNPNNTNELCWDGSLWIKWLSPILRLQ